MPVVWQRNGRGRWEPFWLDARGARLEGHVWVLPQQTGAGDVPPDGPRLLPTDVAAGVRWVLLGSRSWLVRRNGHPLLLDVAVLEHGDQVSVVDRAGGAVGRFYFSTESLAEVSPLPSDTAPTCPRCKQTIEPASLAVCCPTCHVWHHQRDDRPCWTYAARCAACRRQSTALDASLTWSPEEFAQ